MNNWNDPKQFVRHIYKAKGLPEGKPGKQVYRNRSKAQRNCNTVMLGRIYLDVPVFRTLSRDCCFSGHKRTLSLDS